VEKGFRPAKNYELKPEIGVIYTFFDKKFMLESLEADKSPCKIENVHKSVTKNYADYDKIDGEIVVRNRRPGDRIKFAGNDYTTSVKKLFQSNLSREERSRQIMLADSKGLIFVEGYGFADRVKADESTKTVLHCKISPDYHNESIE
jgi:tRNA(Ile)-lysidine synthase